jgi:hypothetical protein
MEVVMLERYFLKPQSADRIRGNWLGSAIERYVEWLEQEGYAARKVYRRVPILCHFGHFAEERGARSLEQAAALVEDFAQHWRSQHAREYASLTAKAKLAEDARNPVNQMLKLVLPEPSGGGCHPYPDPFCNEVPGFFPYLPRPTRDRFRTLGPLENDDLSLGPATRWLYRSLGDRRPPVPRLRGATPGADAATGGSGDPG